MPTKIGFIGAYASIIGVLLTVVALIPSRSTHKTARERAANPTPPAKSVRLAQVAIDPVASQYEEWTKPTLETDRPGAGRAGGCDEYNYLDCSCSYGWEGTEELLDSPKPGRVDAIVSFAFDNLSREPQLLTEVWIQVVDSDYKMGAENEVPFGEAVPAAYRYRIRLKDYGFLSDSPKPATRRLVPPIRIPPKGVGRIQLQLSTNEELATWYVVRFVFRFANGATVDTGRLCGAVAT